MAPEDIEALQLLGNSLRAAGKLEEAAEQYRKILRIDPTRAGVANDLGAALAMQGRLEEAVASFKHVLELRPDYAEGHNNLGNALRIQGRLAEAAAHLQEALRLKPSFADAHGNLGIALLEQRLPEKAVASFRQLLRLTPYNAEAHNYLGNALLAQGKLEEAVACFRQALRLNPVFPDAHNNLGNALKEQGQLDEAVVCFRQALNLKHDFPAAHNNLGNALRKLGQLDDAVACYRRALSLKHDFPEAHNNLGNALKDQGQLDEAIACYEQARQLMPSDPVYAVNRLFSLLYHPRYDGRTLFEEHRRWVLPYQSIADSSPPFANDPSPQRRLRLGYVSPDFRDHVVGRNIWPFLRNHDHGRFEVTLYANLDRADPMTERFRQCAESWCPIAGWEDDRVAERIRQDGIDILVDLALLTSGNRLMVFARKPAPVQVTFVGYPGSTGLSAIDYRLTDPYLDPPGMHDALYAEESYRLPHSFWCFDPQFDEPPVAPLPALAAGRVTFGCLHNFCKVNDGVLELWAEVLRALPGARLLLLAKQGNHRRRTLDYLAQRGIAVERVEFFPPKPRLEYLTLFHQIDMGLDTLPYNGHTSSLDSYWMGVPVLTLVGQTVVGRAGLSQLTNLGLQELAAATPEEFVRLAVELAADLPRLQSLRIGLRQRMRQSPLMDAVGFTRGLEQAYRTMWEKWCAKCGGEGAASRRE